MTAIRTEELLSHVAAHAGITTERAAVLTANVLSGIAPYLSPTIRDLVSSELPETLADALRRGGSSAVPIEERILAPGITLGHAHELVASVCLVLAEDLSEEARSALCAALPPALARLLAPPTPELVRHAEQPRSRSIASGRAGSEHPISESTPDLVQHDSIAASNPHGSSKLSSALGTTQERLHDTLAEGEAGAERPIAGR